MTGSWIYSMFFIDKYAFKQWTLLYNTMNPKISVIQKASSCEPNPLKLDEFSNLGATARTLFITIAGSG